MSSITLPITTHAEPQSAQPKRRLLLWLKRGLIGFVIVLVALASIGATYQAIATLQDKRKYPPPGRMVPGGGVSGHKLHMKIQGEAKGAPTVILEAGMASFSSNWYWVQTELAKDTRVVAYDRAGLGWSESGRQPKDAEHSAQELHMALHSAGISGPYVLAGHSYGGLVARAFARLYPHEVVGMVMVDASHPDQWVRIPASRGGRVNAISSKVFASLSWFGFERITRLATRPLAEGLPARPYAEMGARLALPRTFSTVSDTLAAWDDVTRPQINRAPSLGTMPLVVLAVTEQSLYPEILTALSEELPSLSTNSVRRVMSGATHESLVARREYAMVVVDAIRQVIQAAQTGQPLASR